jgi:hypothetical protein
MFQHSFLLKRLSASNKTLQLEICENTRSKLNICFEGFFVPRTYFGDDASRRDDYPT